MTAMMHEIGVVARTVVSGLAMAAVSCGGSTGPVVVSPIDRGGEAEPSLAECLHGNKLGVTPDELSDPHGQGRDLFGFGLLDSDAKQTYVRVDQLDLQTMRTAQGQAIPGARVVARHLEADPGPAAESLWTGATVQGRLHCSEPRLEGRTISVTARIKQIVKPTAEISAAGSGLWSEFALELELPDGRKIDNACRDPGDTAFPISGYWRDDGAYVPSDRLFSFACTRRDVATCLRQGYREDAPSDKVSLLEACTRMMRADYCGNGDSYTNDGTFVSIWDNRAVSTREVVAEMKFEAAWSEHGAVCLARPRWITKQPRCTLRSCGDADQAMSLAPDMALVFDESCVDHPCKIVHIESAVDETDVKRTTALPRTAGNTANR
jgi:hypothetical protein